MVVVACSNKIRYVIQRTISKVIMKLLDLSHITTGRAE